MSYYPQFMFNLRRSQFVQVRARHCVINLPVAVSACVFVESLGNLLGQVKVYGSVVCVCFSCQLVVGVIAHTGGRGPACELRVS